MTDTTIDSATLSTGRIALLDVVPLWIPAFFGDSNRALKDVQQESYPALAYALFDTARKHFLAECEELDSGADLCRRLRAMVMPRLQFLPRVYRRMAAFYRYALDRAPRQGEEQAGLDQLRAGWQDFFRDEVRFLAEDTETVCLVLVAAANTDSEVAEAEDQLVEILRERYGELTLRRRQEVLGRRSRRSDLGSLLKAARVTRRGFVVSPQVRPNPPD